MRKLLEVADLLSGYTFREAIEQQPQGTIRVIQPRNLNALSDAPLIEPFPKYEKYLLKNDDILLTIKGAGNSVTRLVIDERQDYVCNAAFAVIRPDKSMINPAYLAWYLQHEEIQQLLRSFQTGTTVQNLALKDLQDIAIECLSLETQQTIGRLAALESQRFQMVQELSVKRKTLLDQNLMTIVRKGGIDA